MSTQKIFRLDHYLLSIEITNFWEVWRQQSDMTACMSVHYQNPERHKTHQGYANDCNEQTCNIPIPIRWQIRKEKFLNSMFLYS